ncbi:BTB/POZ domain-containing protein KCTD7-like isoform X5 [Haliotis rufescens]|uniref:BTB/POZ domain-containing protein KCTD7-like isoform X5 n=1 Tax=Haliotis rufescens TaxID=6454 RepID=UPI00201F9850|nr:BTB/POZ domain-containing protein KCTD7-like isoform X5 [Haliotis rufescens]XP_048255940.1 BTB/POZ domain-containing protein KCTD7-like isoform X5 [Haliotis rufescens]
MQDSKVVDLNVGGRHLTTSLSTLTKYPDSMLAAMFSGRHPVAKDQDGRYFIDVDGDVFVHILNFLRFGKMPPPERAQDVNEYAEYFGIQELKAPVTEDFEKVLY